MNTHPKQSYIILPSGPILINYYIEGLSTPSTVMVQPTDTFYEKIKSDLQAGITYDPENYKVENWINQSNPEAVQRLNERFSGTVEVKDDVVYFKNYPLSGRLNEKILAMLSSDVLEEGVINFVEKVLENPRPDIITDLNDFLNYAGLPILSNGNFLAYKAVRPDYFDIYSGTIYNGPGLTIEMPTVAVDNNRNKGCSSGLHVGSLEYVRLYGREDSLVLICEVNPKDVVSVPYDHSCQKLRTSKYYVSEVSSRDALLPEVDLSSAISEKYRESAYELGFAYYEENPTDDPLPYHELVQIAYTVYRLSEISDYQDFHEGYTEAYESNLADQEDSWDDSWDSEESSWDDDWS